VIALSVVFLWATSWVFIKIGLNDIPALTFAGLRYTLAFVCLLPFSLLIQRRSSSPVISRRMWGQLIVLGLLLYTLTQGAIFLALAYLPAVTVNLLWSFSTVTVALLGIIWLAERPTRFQWAGIALAALGAVIYFFPVTLPSGFLIGILVSVVGILANSDAVIVGRDINRSREIHPLVVTAVSMGVGSIVLLIAGIAIQGLPAIGLKGWWIIVCLAVLNTDGTMLIWIPILAVVFLDERISSKELLGLVAAGVGTLIVQLRYPSTLSRLLHREASS
jgi:drug/metabolite transporter (DMT)-like permease